MEILDDMATLEPGEQIRLNWPAHMHLAELSLRSEFMFDDLARLRNRIAAEPLAPPLQRVDELGLHRDVNVFVGAAGPLLIYQLRDYLTKNSGSRP